MATQQELNQEYTVLCTKLGDSLAKQVLYKEQMVLLEAQCEDLKLQALAKVKQKPDEVPTPSLDPNQGLPNGS